MSFGEEPSGESQGDPSLDDPPADLLAQADLLDRVEAELRTALGSLDGR